MEMNSENKKSITGTYNTKINHIGTRLDTSFVVKVKVDSCICEHCQITKVQIGMGGNSSSDDSNIMVCLRF